MVEDKNSTKSSSENNFFKKMTILMLLISTIAVTFIVLNIISNSKQKTNSQQTTKSKDSVVNVSVKDMFNETFVEELSLNAQLKSLNGDVAILAPVSGTLIENNVRLGDYVEVGDTLAVIDGSDIGINYNKAPVQAKTSGTIVASNAVLNQKISSQSPLYTIHPDPIFVLSAYVSEKDADTLFEGAEGYFTTSGDDENIHTATLRYISPEVDTASHRVEIELDVDDDEDNYSGLRNGNYVRLRLVKDMIEDVLIVPSDSVKSYAGKSVVYVLDDNDIARRVFVEKGKSSQTQTVITSGLKVGDKVIIQGSPSDGVKVKVLDK